MCRCEWRSHVDCTFAEGGQACVLFHLRFDWVKHEPGHQKCCCQLHDAASVCLLLGENLAMRRIFLMSRCRFGRIETDIACHINRYGNQIVCLQRHPCCTSATVGVYKATAWQRASSVGKGVRLRTSTKW